MQAEIDAPTPGTPEQVLSGNGAIRKHIGSHRRRSKGIGIEDLVANVLLVVTNDQWPVANEVVEIAERVDRFRCDIAGAHHACAIATIVTSPIRREGCAALGKHLEGRLPTAEYCVLPLGYSPAKRSVPSKRQVVHAIEDETVA